MAEFVERQEYDPSHGTVSVNLPMEKIQNLQENNILVLDQWNTRQVAEEPLLQNSLIRMTHLNRLTNITRHEAGTDMLRIERDYGIVEMFMREDEFDTGAGFKLQSQVRNEQYMIHDSIDGWKAKLLKSHPREVRIEEVQQKKKNFLGF